MPKTVREVPPPLELLCLNALWSLREGNVKDVRQLVARKRPLAYTTIMTVLDRLVRKGLLARRKVGRAFVYVPQTARDAMRRTAVRELLEGFFDGSEQELARFLAADGLAPAPPVPDLAAAAAVAGTSVTVTVTAPPVVSSVTDDVTVEGGEAQIDTVLL
ncbi:MAG TPA: BlaI/MecI/CopY family transcriptional regulator [Bryobacteraceae bacterium]|nr:BlaI/MecI/CopY family transcriptional regulator [Bryobacteraceae bacterium]